MAWLGTWAKRFEITIDQTKVGATLTNFPVAVYLNGSCGTGAYDATEIFDDLGANSLKIAATASDGTTETKVEIEHWDNSGEEAVLHVLLPSISSSEDTIFYLYYDPLEDDNSTNVGVIGSVPGEAVWDSDYEGVWHFANTPGAGNPLICSNSEGTYDATTANMDSNNQVQGHISGSVGYSYNGTNEKTSLTNLITTVLSDATPVTIESVSYYDSSPDYIQVFTNWEPGFVAPAYLLQYYDDGGGAKANFYMYYSGASNVIIGNTVTDDAWHYLAGRYDGTDNMYFNIDEQEELSGDFSGKTLNQVVSTYGVGGYDGSVADYQATKHSELRVSTVNRSDSWVAATYSTLFDELLSVADGAVVAEASGTVPGGGRWGGHGDDTTGAGGWGTGGGGWKSTKSKWQSEKRWD